MFSRSSWLHLRIPFSFFLMPVYLFALASVNEVNPYNAVIVFLALHLFLYPASNGFNSYFDKDEGSIGGLKNPPKVKKGLYHLSLVFDGLALIMGIFNLYFLVMLLIYGLISKAYSHPSIRIKKYPFASWFIAGLFQGFFTFLMAYIGLIDGKFDDLLDTRLLLAASLTSIMLWGSYPMTQIYQHKEDRKRGDITLSIKLGVMGTFYFVMILFSVSSALFGSYYLHYYSTEVSIYYFLAMVPVVTFFFYWYFNSKKDSSKVNFDNTMRLNFLSSLCLSLFFVYLILLN